MAETIEYEQFGGDGAPAQPGTASRPGALDLSRLSDIPMELSVEIGRTRLTVGETLELRVGSVLTLERLAGEAADLLVNGTPIARGEVVVIDDQYGLRVSEVLDSHPHGGADATASASASAADAGAPPAPAPQAESEAAADGADAVEG